jgi:predicted dehydrogenase
MIWIIGSGPMAEAYIKVLQAQRTEFLVIGRGETSAQTLSAQFNIEIKTGGIEKFLKTKPRKCTHAIIAVGVEQLFDVAKLLLDYKIKNILLEKPGILNLKDARTLDKLTKKNKAKISIAYNRRFYASTENALRIIKEDGGVSSMQFEFTEWPHVVTVVQKSKTALKHWLYVNSSHVMDLAFYLGGAPVKIKSFVGGKKKLSWHPDGSIFSGSGVTKKGALFSYSANWLSPGRWGLDILTPKHRLIFRPLEELQIQEIGSVKILPRMIDNSLDLDFKPGIYLQVEKFLKGDLKNFCSISEQANNFKIYTTVLKGN